MRRSGFTRAATSACASFVVLGLARGAVGAPLDPTSNEWDGYAEFVRVAREVWGTGRILATGTIDYSGLKKEDGLILVHPDKSLDTSSLERFMTDGGRVLLLDDYGKGDSLLEHFQIERVPLPPRPALTLRKNPAFPIAEPAGNHPVAADVQRVVLNHATGLEFQKKLTPVLWVRGEGGEPVTVAVAGAVEKGRLLAVGDASACMNAMLTYAGNRAFARALIHYVGDDDLWGARGGRIFIATGAFEQVGSYGDVGAVSAFFSERLRNFHDGIASVRQNGFPTWAVFTSAVALGVAVAFWLVANAAKLHRAAIPRFTRPIDLVAQGGVAGHAEVIAHAKSRRALAVLELKAMLEEALAERVGAEGPLGHPPLLAALGAAKVFPADRLAQLKRVLLRMAQVETLVVSRQEKLMKKIQDAEVVFLAKQAFEFTREARGDAPPKATVV